MVDIKTLNIISNSLRDNLLLENYRPVWKRWGEDLPN